MHTSSDREQNHPEPERAEIAAPKSSGVESSAKSSRLPPVWHAELVELNTHHSSPPQFACMILPHSFEGLLRERESILRLFNAGTDNLSLRAKFAEDTQYLAEASREPHSDPVKFSLALTRTCHAAFEVSFRLFGDNLDDGKILRGWARSILTRSPLYQLTPIHSKSLSYLPTLDTIEGLPTNQSPRAQVAIFPGAYISHPPVTQTETKLLTRSLNTLGWDGVVLPQHTINPFKRNPSKKENRETLATARLDERVALWNSRVGVVCTVGSALGLALLPSHAPENPYLIVAGALSFCLFGCFTIINIIRKVDAHERRHLLEAPPVKS